MFKAWTNEIQSVSSQSSFLTAHGVTKDSRLQIQHSPETAVKSFVLSLWYPREFIHDLCWGQNRLRRNQRQKNFQSISHFPKNRKKSENKKNYQRSNGQLVEMDKLDRPRDSAWSFAKLDQSSSANGRGGSTTDSARRTAELNQSSSANGRAGSTTVSARPFAELDQSSSANGRAELTRIHLHIRLAEHPGSPTLYEEFECSSESTSFRKRSFYKIVKTFKVRKKGPKGPRTRQRAYLQFYEIKPSRYDGLSFITQKKINVKFEG
ncbi:hypothetical protein YC2023_010333 [Brassica napus]